MGIRFIGIDPSTAGGNCPSVWVDEDNGDLLFQGTDVVDADVLATVGERSPIASHERVVRMPARMRDIVARALQ